MNLLFFFIFLDYYLCILCFVWLLEVFYWIWFVCMNRIRMLIVGGLVVDWWGLRDISGIVLLLFSLLLDFFDKCDIVWGFYFWCNVSELFLIYNIFVVCYCWFWKVWCILCMWLLLMLMNGIVKFWNLRRIIFGCVINFIYMMC